MSTGDIGELEDGEIVDNQRSPQPKATSRPKSRPKLRGIVKSTPVHHLLISALLLSAHSVSAGTYDRLSGDLRLGCAGKLTNRNGCGAPRMVMAALAVHHLRTWLQIFLLPFTGELYVKI